MPLGLKIEPKNGTLHLSGALDESSNLSKLVSSTGLLRLNLKDVQSVNSLGLRIFIEAMRALGTRDVEFHECSPAFVEAVNTVPLIVGGQKRVSRIKSVVVPFTCYDGHKSALVTMIKDVSIDGRTINLPKVACPMCKQAVEIEGGMEPEDYFFFLIAN